VEKRLPLFLLLSFAVLMGWMLFTQEPLKPRPAQDGAAVNATTSDSPADQQPAVELPPAIGEVRVETEERETGELIFGAGSEIGTYLARFSNRGARIVELRLGDYVGREGLDKDEWANPENWVQLLQPIDQRDGSQTGSMILRTSESSKDLERGTGFDEALWTMKVLEDSNGPRGVEFELAPGSGIRFVKRFLFEPGTRRFVMELELHNDGGVTGSPIREFILTPASSVPREVEDTFYLGPQAVAAGPLGAKVNEMTFAYKERSESAKDLSDPLTAPPPLAFAGVHSKYFAVVMRERLAKPTDRPTMIGATYARVYDAAFVAENPTEARNGLKYIDADVYLELRLPEPGQSQKYTYEVYAGPKEHDSFLAADPAHDLIVEEDLGMMSGIGNVLVWILSLLHRVTGNWGTSIIVLTLFIRILLFPLNRRFQTSMARYQKKMKRVQPKIAELKERYKDDAQKQRQEQAKLMQEEGAFPPLGGCLPMFMQIPIFIGLFSALRTNFDLRQAPFYGWITDLSQPDRLLTLDVVVPFIGYELTYLNVLPILMIVLWVAQQRGMPAPADEQAARMQKMMAFMPIVMGVFLYNYAAGLSLYMITQSGLGIFEQKFIKKHWPIDDTEEEPKKEKRGCGPFSGFMENIAEKQKEHLKRMEAVKKGQQHQKKGGSKKRKKR